MTSLSTQLLIRRNGAELEKLSRPTDVLDQYRNEPNLGVLLRASLHELSDVSYVAAVIARRSLQSARLQPHSTSS